MIVHYNNKFMNPDTSIAIAIAGFQTKYRRSGVEGKYDTSDDLGNIDRIASIAVAKAATGRSGRYDAIRRQ